MPAILARLEVNEEEEFSYFSTDPQRSEAKYVLRNSHLIMLAVLNRINEHFKLGIDQELFALGYDFEASWPPLDEAEIPE